MEEPVTVDAIEVAEQREAELRAILDSMPDAVYIGGAEGMTLVNQAALDQLGFATREELNRSVAVLADEVDVRDAETGELVPPEEQVFSRALRGERAVSFVRVRHRLTGERRLVRSAASPVLLDGRVIAAVASSPPGKPLQFLPSVFFVLSCGRGSRLLMKPQALRHLSSPSRTKHGELRH